jgi:putative transposase
MLDRIFYVCKTGCQWNQLQVEGCSWKTVFHYFNLWSKLRLFENSFYRFANDVCTANVVVDTTFVKNVCGRDVVGRNPTDRGRKATKVSLITNEYGTPLTTCFHKANKNDSITLKHLLGTCARKTGKLRDATTLLADKGYDSEVCRSICRSHNLEPMIPKRGEKDVYKGRYVVEQTFGILDAYRRIRVRYESTIRNFKSFHYLAYACIVCNRLSAVSGRQSA